MVFRVAGHQHKSDQSLTLGHRRKPDRRRKDAGFYQLVRDLFHLGIVPDRPGNNVTLTYITNLTRSAQQVIQFEYNINSEYTFEAIRDENGVVSFDILIRKRKR